MGCDGMTALRDLRARGGFARDGGMLSRFALELHGEQLHIYGRDTCYINAARTKVLQREYHYYLEEAEAARLLAALREDYGTAEPPERFLPRKFEFTRSERPLYDYLDARGIAYTYTEDKIPP